VTQARVMSTPAPGQSELFEPTYLTRVHIRPVSTVVARGTRNVLGTVKRRNGRMKNRHSGMCEKSSIECKEMVNGDGE